MNELTRVSSRRTALVVVRPERGPNLRLRSWQWGFGALGPLALIVIDLRLFGGWLLSVAPATFWGMALIAPNVLALSAKRWGGGFDRVLSGMVVGCAVIALVTAMMPVIIFLVMMLPGEIAGEGDPNFLMGLLLVSALSVLFAWPLYFCYSAFRRQARLRLKRRRDYRARPTVWGMALLVIMLASLEVGDRFWFGSMVDKLRSREVAEVLDGAGQLQIYPIALMTRTEAVCAPLYAQPPNSFVSADSLDNQLSWAWGRDAQKVRAAARKLFGAGASRVCAEALSSD